MLRSHWDARVLNATPPTPPPQKKKKKKAWNARKYHWQFTDPDRMSVVPAVISIRIITLEYYKLWSTWPPIHLLHRIYQWDKTFCFVLFLRTKFWKSGNAIQRDTYWAFEHCYGFWMNMWLDSLKYVVVEKRALFPTSTQVLEPIYVSWQNN